MAQTLKNLPTMKDTRVWYLDWEDPLEKEMASHSSILAWRIPCTEKPGRLQSIQSMGSKRVRHNWLTNTFTFKTPEFITIKKQQLELDMERQTGSQLGNEYVKSVYCHPNYLTSLKITSCEMLGWMNDKLESRLPGEISTTSDMKIIPL